MINGEIDQNFTTGLKNMEANSQWVGIEGLISGQKVNNGIYSRQIPAYRTCLGLENKFQVFIDVLFR